MSAGRNPLEAVKAGSYNNRHGQSRTLYSEVSYHVIIYVRMRSRLTSQFAGSA
jgi:hypothetical protein